MMVHRRNLVGLILLLIPILVMLLASGCDNDVLSSNLATVNAAGTLAASGNLGITPPSFPGFDTGGGDQGGAPGAPTTPPNLFDIRNDPSGDLIVTWATVYRLPSGSEFTIIASEWQAANLVVQSIRSAGFQNTVRDGSVALGVGQVRIDLALAIGPDGDPDQQTGNGTVVFAPTLDAIGGLHLNPYPANFGALRVPGNLLSATGDSVHTLLSGSTGGFFGNQVTLHVIVLDSGTMQVSGRVR